MVGLLPFAATWGEAIWHGAPDSHTDNPYTPNHPITLCRAQTLSRNRTHGAEQEPTLEMARPHPASSRKKKKVLTSRAMWDTGSM